MAMACNNINKLMKAMIMAMTCVMCVCVLVMKQCVA